MMYELKFSKEALNDLDNLFNYISSKLLEPLTAKKRSQTSTNKLTA